MRYIVKNNNTGRVYEVESDHKISLDIVWASEKCWFSSNCSVTIADENGNSKTFAK